MSNGKISLTYGLRWKRILAVIVLIIYQLIGQIVLSSLVIRHAETMCIERLGEAVHNFNRNYYEHAMADREQLRVVADMITVLMEEDEHDLSLHLSSFEQRGMLDWLQILLPDGTLITGSGKYNVSGQLSYANEAARLPYISPVSNGLVDASKKVIRSAVPITHEGETIAVLYGVYDLSAGHAPDGVNLFGGQAYTYVLESDSGHYLINTLQGASTISYFPNNYVAKSGYDLDLLAADLDACREGFSAFRSRTIDDNMYIYYAPIGINKWITMISVPESAAMRYAYESSGLMLGSMVYISLGVLVYFIVLYITDHKLQSKNQFVSSVQSRLMEVYSKPEYYAESLLAVARRARSGAVFIIDEIQPHAQSINGDNQQLLSAYQQQQDMLHHELLLISRQNRKSLTLTRKHHLLQQHPLLLRFMEEQHVTSIALVPIVSADGTIHQVIGAINPANPDILPLLNTVSVSFLMAASSMDYLNRLEIASTVDGLTGVMNRACYHLQLDRLSSRKVNGFGCVYIDVNDLHAINNRYGHEKGDSMLRCISAALSNAFGQKNVFRFGGDEFVILIENVTKDWLEEKTQQADQAIRSEGYTVSIGTDWAEETTDIHSMIRNAETRMYSAKYLFYQQKQKQNQAALPSLEHKAVRRLLTENADVNDFLEVAEHHYRGVFYVNLHTDEAREIFARHYFSNALQVAAQQFSTAFHQYMAEVVDKQSRRSIQNFFDYQQIMEQMTMGNAPTIEYSTVSGERIRLTVHPSPRYSTEKPDTLWVFESAGAQ